MQKESASLWDAPILSQELQSVKGICNVRHVTEVRMNICSEVMLGFQMSVVRVIPATLYDFTLIS